MPERLVLKVRDQKMYEGNMVAVAMSGAAITVIRDGMLDFAYALKPGDYAQFTHSSGGLLTISVNE